MNSSKAKSTRKFGVLLLTHGKPDNVLTFPLLRKGGYTGRIVIVCDTEDKKLDEYKERFGKEPNTEVVVFDKASVPFDRAITAASRKAIAFARNNSFEIAKAAGLTHFIQLDDDYTQMRYTYNENGEWGWHAHIKNLDRVFHILCDFLDVSGAFSVAMAQGGDFIGGADGHNAKKRKPWRKCMNSFVCRTDRPFTFIGTVNEDVSTYTTLGSRGHLMFTIPEVALSQVMTQTAGNGMADLYNDFGTYVKSFTTVMMMPSCVSISEMGWKFRRIHHQIQWNNCTPCIVSPDLRKSKRVPKDWMKQRLEQVAILKPRSLFSESKPSTKKAARKRSK